MDALGSFPRMSYLNDEQTKTEDDDDQKGSWFGLAMAGLKFLISNPSHSTGNKSSPPTQPTQQPSAPQRASKQQLRILGPSGFRKTLYGIPEDESTHQADRDKVDNNSNTRSLKTSKRLTKQALQQFNGNFSNYWNQRSSLRSRPSEHGDRTVSEAELTSNDAHSLVLAAQDTSSDMNHTIHQERQPSMTSSQIIHPTQDKHNKPQLRRSHSYPLLHSAEHMQDFERFQRDVMPHDPSNAQGTSTAGMTTPLDRIPSPPLSMESSARTGVLFAKLENVHPVQSWDSLPSSNATPVGSERDGVMYTGNDGSQACISNHFNNSRSPAKQRQWMRQTVSSMRNHGKDANEETCSTEEKSSSMMHVHDGSKTTSAASTKRKSTKSTKTTQEEDNTFSDWSNVSSNIGSTTTSIAQ